MLNYDISGFNFSIMLRQNCISIRNDDIFIKIIVRLWSNENDLHRLKF